MTEPLLNPHDRFFKEVFSRQETARDFLQHYLPPDISHLLDFASLEISKDSFIDPDLQEHFSDLLYKVALHTGQDTFIYVLFEHKSYPDREVALQLLRYMVRIWEQNLKQKQKLLPVLPLVIYHGRVRWTAAPNFSALFVDVPAELQPYLPEYRYWLCDLTQYSDEQIQGQIILRAILLLLKYILRDDLRQHLGQVFRLLQELSEQRTALEYLETMLRYVSGGTEKIKPDELKQVLTEVFGEGEKLMPTIAEQWIEQGRAEGLAQGREEGREEGREAILTILRRFLAQRFGVALDHFDDDFEGLDLASITRLSDAAFEVGTLAEFKVRLVELKNENSRQSNHGNETLN